MHRRIQLFLSVFFVLISFQTAASPEFTKDEYRAHLEFLASDLLEGRATGSRGTHIAAEYITACFRSLGLKPGGDSGSFLQSIAFNGFDSHEKKMTVSLTNSGGTHWVRPIEEICMVSERADLSRIDLEDDLWFVGYGIQAPEYDWDDFKGVNIRGRTIVVLVNDPDPAASGFADESLTYYGRWTYKIEMARRRGARALIMIHTDREATYGWNVVQTSWTGERIAFREPRAHHLTAIAWIRHTALNRALKKTGLCYAGLKAMADRRDFHPFSLNTKWHARFPQTHRRMDCANVIGVLPGTDPELKKEAVLFTAHYDHLGVGLPDDKGDNIYNGALDNASGTAAVLCLARAFAENPEKPKRTLVFMPVTGEELGLLGSTWYAGNPLIPLERTVVVINKDCMNHFGRRAQFSAFPVEYSTALADVAGIGKSMGLELITHSVDRGGGAFRSDHFPFAARGVTALSVGMRGPYLDLSDAEIRKIRAGIGPTYHRPNDEVHPLWRYDGILQELTLLYTLGRYWADGAPAPQMKIDEKCPFAATMRWYGTRGSKPRPGDR